MRRSLLHRRASGDHGSVAIWMFLMLFFLLAFAGLAIDFWRIWDTRRELHGMADAAAVAGATSVNEGVYRFTNNVVLEAGNARDLANATLDAQTDAPTLTNRVVATSPIPFPGRVYVRLETEVDLGLMRIFATSSSVSVEAESTAFPYQSDPILDP
jgi:Flp pilus assembly protein TadG